jgi:hypothetical protein
MRWLAEAMLTLCGQNGRKNGRWNLRIGKDEYRSSA